MTYQETWQIVTGLITYYKKSMQEVKKNLAHINSISHSNTKSDHHTKPIYQTTRHCKLINIYVIVTLVYILT